MQGLDGWSEFNVAIAGADAALAGLIIVALSVNIEKILASGPAMPSRAAAAISGLILGVIACGIALIPGLPLWGYGLAVLVPAGAAGVFAQRSAVYIVRGERGGMRVGHLLTVAAAPLLFLAGAILLLAAVPAGMILVAFGSLAAIVAAVVYAWVALVEILR